MKNLYIVQPYEVGSKSAKSLVVCIPSKIAKKFNIHTSTAFALRTNDQTKQVTLETIEIKEDYGRQ